MSEGKTIVIVSGYFNPIHNGHIDYLELSKELGDYLVVIVNNDAQQLMKKGSIIMNENQRMRIVDALKPVDEAFLSIDNDASVCESIRKIHSLKFPDFSKFIFANGGDRHIEEIPESIVCRELGIELKEGMGEKVESSSNILSRHKMETK